MEERQWAVRVRDNEDKPNTIYVNAETAEEARLVAAQDHDVSRVISARRVR